MMVSPEKVCQEAIKWLASEHHFFVELKRDLHHLKEDLDEAKGKGQVKDIKLCFKDFRYVAISERRFNQREQHLERVLQDLLNHNIAVSGSIAEIEQLIQRLKTEARNLIHDASLQEGKIKDYLIHLQVAIQDHEIEPAQALLMELTRLIESAEQWIAALSIDLEKAKELIAELQEEKDPSLENLVKPETRAALEAILKDKGWSSVYSSVYEDGSRYFVAGVLRERTLTIMLFPKTKTIELTFSQPPGTQWRQKEFKIVYDLLQQRARGQTFRNFLEILLPELYKASMPYALKGPGHGSGSDLPEIIRKALGN